MESFVVATNNQHKLKEFQQIFEPYGIKVLSLNDVNININIEENGSTFQENAAIKAETIAKMTNLATIADDSGLCIEALNGAPGVYSARYEGEHTPYEIKNQIIINRLKKISNRRAKFVCAIAFSIPNKPTVLIEEECMGEIAHQPSGNGGFGYDPIFYLPLQKKTMADLAPEIKNQISHRAKALQSFIRWYQENNV